MDNANRDERWDHTANIASTILAANGAWIDPDQLHPYRNYEAHEVEPDEDDVLRMLENAGF